MKTAGGMSACCWMLLSVTVPPGETGFGDALAVIVIGMRLDCVGIKLLTQAVLNVMALAGLAGSKKTLATTANVPRTAVLRRLVMLPPVFAISVAVFMERCVHRTRPRFIYPKTRKVKAVPYYFKH